MRARLFSLFIAALLGFATLQAASAATAPDRQLYLSAKKDYELLAKNKITPQNRVQWQRAAERFERLPQEFPKSRYCDAAYYYAGRIYQETYASSKDARAVDRSIRNY